MTAYGTVRSNIWNVSMASRVSMEGRVRSVMGSGCLRLAERRISGISSMLCLCEGKIDGDWDGMKIDCENDQDDQVKEMEGGMWGERSR